MIYHSYRLNKDTELLYFVNKSNSNRICISTNLKKKIFEFVYDNYAHESFYKTIDRLRSSTYCLKMRKKIRSYIKNCSTCQLSKSSRRPFYEKLHLIKIIAKSLVQLFMNFIMILSMITQKHNALLTITNRFSKYIRLVLDRKNWGATEWTNAYHAHIFRHWKLFNWIIFDRNLKFTSDFWTTFFQKSEIKLNLITVYHSLINDQNEKINQIIEIALRCLLMSKYEEL